MPRLILFLLLAALVGRLKSILTTSFFFWPWEHSPCLGPSVISSSSISWKEFASALLLNLFAISRFSQRTFWKKDAGRISSTLVFSFLFQDCFTINLLFSFPCTPFGSEPYFSWFSLLLHLHVAISSLGTRFEFQHAFLEPSSRKSHLLTHITPFIILVTHYSAWMPWWEQTILL